MNSTSMGRRGRAFVLSAGIGAHALSCSHEPPPTAGLRPIGGAPPPSEAVLSRFSVPLAYDFSGMIDVVERAVPRTLGSLDSVRVVGTDTRRHYAFEAHRGAFTAFAHGRELHLRATVAYEARGFYKPVLGPTLSAGCGTERDHPRIVIELATPVSLTSDWHLSSRARLVHLGPASDGPRDRCDVGILHKDVTDQVVGAARSAVTAHLGDIDRRVGQIDLRPRFEQWWALLGRPIALRPGVWLTLGPQRLRIGAVSGRERTLVVPVTLDARPRIIAADSVPEASHAPLPPLGHDSGAAGFRIMVDGLTDFGTASRELTHAFASRTIRQAHRTIRVQRVAVSPAPAGQLALSLAFDGDARGVLDLVGTPVYDPARRELVVPDLDYALAVNDRLVHTYAWLRDDQLRAAFRDRAHFPVAVALARGRAMLTEGLNRRIGDAVWLSATVDSVSVTGVYVTRDAVVIRAEARGQAAVTVRP